MATTSWIWSNASGGVWTTGANWSGGTAPPTSTAAPGSLGAKNAIIDLSTATSGPITLFSSGGGTIVAGAVSITANATLDINTGQELTAGGPGSGAGANIAVNAGTVEMAGGVLAYKSIVAGGGEIIGNGTLTDLSGSVGVLTTSNGGSIVASGGVLEVVGNAGNAVTVSGTYDIASGAVLQFGSYTALNAPVINFGGVAGTLIAGSAANQGSIFSNSGATGTLLATLDNLAVETSGTSGAGASEISFYIASGATVSSTAIIGGSTLEVISNTNTYWFDTNGSFTGKHVDWLAPVANSGGGSTETIFVDNNPCYTAGTRILTVHGDVAVEELAEGDLVVTLSGESRTPQPVKWIGQRRINLRQHPQPNVAAPVRIRQDAFGPGMPVRDLLVSPDHCLFVDGKLIPAKLLINDMTIVHELDTAAVQYYHVELDRHAVILAEGLPAETYLDTGNRAMFANAGLALTLHPEFTVNAGLKCWEADACAPLTLSPDAVKPIWAELVERAESLGYHRPEFATTTDPDLHLLADGRPIRPLSSDGDRYVFPLPAGVTSLRLVSRAAVPSSFEAYLDDWRQLGVAIRRILLRDSTGVTEIPADHPALAQGWHQVESDGATLWRWTNGNAALPIPEVSGAALVEVHVGMAMTYLAPQGVVETKQLAAA